MEEARVEHLSGRLDVLSSQTRNGDVASESLGVLLNTPGRPNGERATHGEHKFRARINRLEVFVLRAQNDDEAL
jgi:hypothetical protein